MIFSEQMAAIAKRIEQRMRDVHLKTVQLAYESVVNGSPITGAPGQPVDTGNLKTSWQIIPEGPLTHRITTNVVYASQIEAGTRAGRALTLRSEVGGFHSVALTRAGWPLIVAEAMRQVG